MEIAKLEISTYAATVSQVVTTSFAQMPTRHTALIRLEDENGNSGWGEIWGNFPTPTSHYRAELARWALPNHLVGARIESPEEFCDQLANKLHVLRIQADEPGPVAAIVAATNQALWDLKARREGVALHKLLNSGSRDRMPAYASGLNPNDCVETVAQCRSDGYRAYKLKIGFGDKTDIPNIERINADMVDGERLFTDANQRWSLDEALVAVKSFEPLGLGWLEEPMSADRPAKHWKALKNATSLKLAGGENIYSEDTLAASNEWLDFVQPDVGKWGGIDGCLRVARNTIEAGNIYCPHWLAGGVGLLHSAHLLSAAGGDGLLEIDSNENPLRSALVGTETIDNGMFVIPQGSGIGLDPRESSIEQYRTSESSHA